MESNLFLENIYNKEYTNHEFFFSEIKSTDPNIHYNTVNEFSIPITLPNEEPMKFNKGSIVHLKEMTLPSNVIVLTESEQAVKDNADLYLNRMIPTEGPTIFKKGSMSNILEADVEMGMYLSRIQYYMDFTNIQSQNPTYDWEPIVRETAILEDLITQINAKVFPYNRTLQYAYNTLTEKTNVNQVILDWFPVELSKYRSVQATSSIKRKDLFTPMNDFYLNDKNSVMLLPMALMSNYFFYNSSLDYSWLVTNISTAGIDKLLRILFKESNDGKALSNALEWSISNKKSTAYNCGSAESIFLLHGRRPYVYYNYDDYCPQWDEKFPCFPVPNVTKRQLALPDLMLYGIYEQSGLQIPGRMKVFDLGMISIFENSNATPQTTPYEQLFFRVRSLYQTYNSKTGTWTDKSYAEVQALPFMIFVEHMNNTKDPKMLNLIDPDNSNVLFNGLFPDNTINERKITYRITPEIYTIDNGIYDVRTVKVELYLQNMVKSPLVAGDKRNLAYKQFVPWNVGLAVESFIQKCSSALEITWTPGGTYHWTETTFKPIIDLVYRTCIDAQMSTNPTLPNDKNDTKILNGFLQETVFYYLTQKAITSDYLKPNKSGLPLFPPHHFLNLMTQIYYPVDQTTTHYKTYQYRMSGIPVKQIPFPYHRSREVVWKDYQFRAPDFLHNALYGGDSKLKAKNIPYPIDTIYKPTIPADIAPKGSGENFWILPSLTSDMTMDVYKKVANMFVSPYPYPNEDGSTKSTGMLTITTSTPPKASDDLFFLTQSKDSMVLNPNVGDPYVELLFYMKEIEPVISNDIQPPLNSTLFLKRKRAPTDDDYNKCKIASKSYLNQSDISQLNVYSSTDSGGILYQVDAQGNIINNWTQSLPIRNLKLSIYEPMANIGNKRYTVVLQRERTKFDVEKNPYTFKMSAENIRSIAGLSRSKRKYLCTLAIINGMSTQIKNFKPLDKNMWITIDGIEQQAVFLNSQVMDNVIMTVDMAPYIALGDSSVNINFENETNPQFDGLYRKFVINDADDFGHLYVTFYNSDHERLIFDETTVYNNPSLTFYFQII